LTISRMIGSARSAELRRTCLNPHSQKACGGSKRFRVHALQLQ
jgi:hypothetical protein